MTWHSNSTYYKCNKIKRSAPERRRVQPKQWFQMRKPSNLAHSATPHVALPCTFTRSDPPCRESGPGASKPSFLRLHGCVCDEDMKKRR